MGHDAARGRSSGAGKSRPERKSKPVPAGDGPQPPGLAARESAVRLLAAVIRNNRSLDDALAKEFAASTLEPRDRGLARLIASTALRHRGEIEALLSSFLEKPLPERQGNLWPILVAGAAQLLFLATPPHAAVGLAVEQARRDRAAARYDKLVNALLRRVTREGLDVLLDRDPVRLNIPAWMLKRWNAAYGEDVARHIGEASLTEAPLDLSVKADAAGWAEKLGGIVLPTGSVRLAAGGRIEDLAGYADGAWWVQDAAAALPARLLGPVAGLRVADICAAPGGKSVQLAAAGADVTAVDASAARLERLRANFERLKLPVMAVAGDAATWAPGHQFDAVLLDVPCTSTGTIRRHPDILHLKRPHDIEVLSQTQARLLDNAAKLVKPGGTLVYCTCSLEPEEGPQQIARLLKREPEFERVPVQPDECGIAPEWITPEGDLRTLPFHLPNARPELAGLDGFYAARLKRRS